MTSERRSMAAKRNNAQFSFQLGEYTISTMPGGDLWISHSDGEGMQVSIEHFERVVDEYFKEHM